MNKTTDGDAPRPRQEHPRLSLALELALLFAGLLLYFGTVLFPGDRVFSVDGLFHIKYADLLRRESLALPFTWLPVSVVGESGVNPHWGFHLLLIPFTLLGDLFVALKSSAVFYASAAVMALYLVLRRAGAPAALIWVLLLLALDPRVPLDLLRGRAPTVALIFLFAFIHCLHRRKHRGVAVTAFLFMESYHAAAALPLLALIHVAARRFVEGKLELRPLLYCCIGLGLGLLLNPYFPENIQFFVTALLLKSQKTITMLLMEWGADSTATALRDYWPLFAVGVASYALALRRSFPVSVATWSSLGYATYFLVMYLRSSRFDEYLVPLSILFFGHLFRDAAAAVKGIAETDGARAWPGPRAKAALLGGAAVVLLAGAVYTNRQAAAIVARDGTHREDGAAVGRWLAANTEPGEAVFNYRWDSFAPLFFHNHHNRYAIGLDPAWLYGADPEAFSRYWEIAYERSNKVDLAGVMREKFKARFAVAPKTERALEYFSRFGWRRRYAGPYYTVFQAPDAQRPGAHR